MSRSLLALSFMLAATPTSEPAAPCVTIETSKGNITLELMPESTPATVENFLAYVDDSYYDGLIFHRVIEGFMIQGGGVDSQYRSRQTRPPVANESIEGEANLRGTIAMARTSDPDSATAQFFINHRDNPPLDATGSRPGYTVFGRVTGGMDVVDAIAVSPTGSGGPFRSDVPVDPVIIHSIRRCGDTD